MSNGLVCTSCGVELERFQAWAFMEDGTLSNVRNKVLNVTAGQCVHTDVPCLEATALARCVDVSRDDLPTLF